MFLKVAKNELWFFETSSSSKSCVALQLEMAIQQAHSWRFRPGKSVNKYDKGSDNP